MRQPPNHSKRYRSLIFFATILFSTFSFQIAAAQKATVLVLKAICRNGELNIDFEIKRFKSQKMRLNLTDMKTNVTKIFPIDKSQVIQKMDNCTVNLKIKFPPGDTQIILFDEYNQAICNPRRRNTDRNAENYDPSKGNK